MNKIEKMKQAVIDNFEDIWFNRGYGEEGRVEHPKYGGRPTHCRSFMYTLAKVFHPSRILEIGTWEGASSFMMATSMDENYPEISDSVKIYTWDLIPGGYSRSEKLYKHPNVSMNYWLPWKTDYDIWKNYSPIAHPEFKNYSNEEILLKNQELLENVAGDDTFDLILLDGDHSFLGVSLDWKLIQKYCDKTTIIVIDDLADIRHKQVRDFFDSLNTTKVDFDDWNNDPKNPLFSTGLTLHEGF